MNGFGFVRGGIPRVFLMLLAVLSVNAYACTVPTDGLDINQSDTFCGGVYILNSTIDITNHSVVLDCNGSTIEGNGTGATWGFEIEGYDNVTIKNCVINNYFSGIYANNTVNTTISNNTIGTSTVALWLSWTDASSISGNALVGQTVGAAPYDCNSLSFTNNSITDSVLYGIVNDAGTKNSYLLANYFNNNLQGDVKADAGATWYEMGTNVTRMYTDSIVNVTNGGGYLEDYTFDIAPLTSIDTVSNPGQAVAANVTIDSPVIYADAEVYYLDSYQVDPNFVIANGHPCTPSECSNVVYNNDTGQVNFTALRFSSFALGNVSSCTVPTDGMNISYSTTFCNGWYNLDNGVNIVNDSVVLDCNGSTLNGTGFIGLATGIFANGVDYITVKNCNVNAYQTGILYNDSDHGFVINNNATDEFANIAIIKSHGDVVDGNRVTIGVYGIVLDLAQNNTISDNVVFNHFVNGIYLIFTSTNNILSYNVFVASLGGDIFADADSSWVIVGTGVNATYWDSIVNATAGTTIEDWVNFDTGVASADTATNDGVNAPANITMSGFTGSNVTPFYWITYSTNQADIIANGAACPPADCSNIVYNATTGVLTFTAKHFSSFAGNETISPTPPTPPTPSTSGVGAVIVLGSVALLLAAIGAKMGYAPLVWGAGLAMLMITIAAALAVI